MKIEKLNDNGKKVKIAFIIGFVLCAIIMIVINLLTSKAKYQNTQSVNIATGKVSYSASDLDVVSMYIVEENQDKSIDKIPEGEYILSNKSYCKTNDTEKDTSIKITYEKKEINISHVTKKGTKCYIYFEKIPTAEDTLAKLNMQSKGKKESFTAAATTDEGIWSAPDGMYGGTSYYWRGAVTNNYVKFAGFYWRIIRINGDGSIRIIYDGKSVHNNGTRCSNCSIGDKAYNTYSGYDNKTEYVGLKYTIGQSHGYDTASTILGNDTDTTSLYGWYKTNIVDKNYDDKVDQGGLFCNDRVSTADRSQTWDDWKKTKIDANLTGISYGARMRFYPDKIANPETPTLNCQDSTNDIFSKIGSTKGNKSLTYPVGLITADEVVFAGGFGETRCTNYYLYIGHSFWTMSPSISDDMFIIDWNGALDSDMDESFDRKDGVRPVINLKANVEFKAGSNGSSSNPFEVI